MRPVGRRSARGWWWGNGYLHGTVEVQPSLHTNYPTTFQSMWIGAADCCFFAITLATNEGWRDPGAWRAFALFNGFVGMGSMIGAVAPMLWPRWLYLARYGRQLVRLA